MRPHRLVPARTLRTPDHRRAFDPSGLCGSAQRPAREPRLMCPSSGDCLLALCSLRLPGTRVETRAPGSVSIRPGRTDTHQYRGSRVARTGVGRRPSMVAYRGRHGRTRDTLRRSVRRRGAPSSGTVRPLSGKSARRVTASNSSSVRRAAASGSSWAMQTAISFTRSRSGSVQAICMRRCA